MQILDSGNRTEYDTGAVRDIKEGKGRMDLLPLDIVAEITASGIIMSIANGRYCDALASFAHEAYINEYDMILQVAKHFEDGAKKYGERNWEKGIPTHSYLDSAIRHYIKYKLGYDDEPHDRAFAWNLMCLEWTKRHIPEMDDIPNERRGHEDGESLQAKLSESLRKMPLRL